MMVFLLKSKLGRESKILRIGKIALTVFAFFFSQRPTVAIQLLKVKPSISICKQTRYYMYKKEKRTTDNLRLFIHESLKGAWI